MEQKEKKKDGILSSLEWEKLTKLDRGSKTSIFSLVSGQGRELLAPDETR